MITSNTNHKRSILLSLALALSVSVFFLAACGTLEIGLVSPTTGATDADNPTAATTSPEAAPLIAPRTPTPVPDDYQLPTPEPAFTPVPIDDYAVPNGLRVAFVKDGGVWLWLAGNKVATLLTSVGDDVRDARLSDDGLVVVFRRADELWAINSDGQNERQLLGAGDFRVMEPTNPGVTLSRFEWVPGTHTVAFNTRLRSDGRPLNADLRLVDAVTLEQTVLLPPDQGGEFTYSLDGSQVAVVTPGDISLLNADGTNRRDGVLTYTPIAMYSEDDYYVKPMWAADGNALMVAVPPANPDARPLQHTTIWRIPTDGTSAELITTINALPVEGAVSFSPDLNYVAYGEVLQWGDTQAEIQVQLKVVRLRNGDWQAYLDMDALYGWGPDSRRFAFVAGRERPQLQIGQWSGGTIPGSVDAGVPVHGFRWVDVDHYIFVARYDWEQGAEGDRFNLALGDIGGSNTVLVSATEDITYDFVLTSIAAAAARCLDGGVPAIEAPIAVDTSDWKSYEDAERGFQFRYPGGWRLEVFDSWVGVGPEEMGEDVRWGVRLFDSLDTTLEQVIADVGRQFGTSRSEVRTCVYVDGLAAIKATVITSEIEDWYAESVVFEHQGIIFEISNGAVRDERFRAFYASFHLNR